MNLVIGLILLFILLQAIKQFGRMDAATAARIIRHGGGVVGMIGALLLLLRGRVGLAATVAGMVANFAGWKTTGGASPRFQQCGRRARVRDGPRSPARRWWRCGSTIRQRRDDRNGPGRRLCGPRDRNSVASGAFRPASGARARRSRRRQPVRGISRPPVRRLA